MPRRLAALATLALALSLQPIAAQAGSPPPQLSARQDLAIFGLGYYGWNIPPEALGGIDQRTRKVFVDLGRFNVIGIEQRLSTSGLSEFIAAIRKAKEGSVLLPERYQFGEATLTEADWNQLVGAFIVAVPVVSAYDSRWNARTLQFETRLTVHVTFMDVASGGSTLGVAEVQASGSDRNDQGLSIRGALDSIPSQLQFEIRKVAAFQISSKVLSAKGDQVKMALGRDMGIMVGDEYSVVERSTVGGYKDDREVGLLVVTSVGAEVSTARAVYGGARVTPEASLQEIPRLGFDLEPYAHVFVGSGGLEFVPGFRGVVSRGFEGFRPMAAVQVPVKQMFGFLSALVIPVDLTLGGEYGLNLGRLSLTGWGGVGVGYVHLMEALSATNADTDFLAHLGAQAWAKAALLVTRDLRVFGEAGIEYWIPLRSLFEGYGGLGFGAGIELKL